MKLPSPNQKALVSRYRATYFYLLPVDLRLVCRIQTHDERMEFRSSAAIFAQLIRQPSAPVELYYHYARTLNRLGMLEQAHAALCEALARQPGYQEAHSMIGLVLLQMGDLDAAGDHLRTAVSLDPPDSTTWARLGLLYAKLGHRTATIQCVQRAVVLNPSNLRLHRRLAELLSSDAGNAKWKPGT